MAESEPPHPPTSPGGLEPISELIDLGQRLRRAREGRGIGVAELADRLHLAPEQLAALENGDRNHLHEPVFVIAQAKRVAQALGVDVSQQVESLRHSRLMQPLPPQFSAASSAAPSPPGNGRATAPAEFPTRSPRWPLVAASTALTLLLGLVAARAFRLWGQPRPAPPPTGAIPPLAKGGIAQAGVLLLRSDEPSWVEVRNGSGQVLFSGILEKEARFRLGEGLRVLAGRPDLVTATIGAEPPRRLGTISEVDWQEFAATPPAPEPTPAP